MNTNGSDGEHLSPAELADAAANVLSVERASEVSEHLAHCSPCSTQACELSETSQLLREEPRPEMPAPVLESLLKTIRTEVDRRATGIAEREQLQHHAEVAKRMSWGSFSDNPAYGSKVVRPDRATLDQD